MEVQDILKAFSTQTVLYQYQPNTNKLTSVGNTTNPAAYATYTYDDLGQLKTQNKTGAAFGYNLKYDVTGKITGIYADAALTQLKVAYGYDENGNRISTTDNTGTTPQTTYTVFDASGTPLAMYNNTTLSQVPIYGAERLGTYTPASNSYVYELRDNVGSVRLVIGNTKTTTGQANIFTYTDYYPYGSIARSGGITYRYEYQGAYADKDPITGFNNFDLRMYDGRIGRWLSTDPNAQYYSPYVGMGNNPGNGYDKDGGVYWWIPGAVGAAVGTGFNIAAQLGDNNFDLSSSTTWKRMGVAATAGFVMAYVPESWAAIPLVAGGSAAANVIDQKIKGNKAINKKEVFANFVGGAGGYYVGSFVGKNLALGTVGSSLLIRNFNLNYRDELVQQALKGASEAVGGISGGHAGNLLNNWMNHTNFSVPDNLIRGTTPWGQNWTATPGSTVQLNEIVVKP